MGHRYTHTYYRSLLEKTIFKATVGQLGKGNKLVGETLAGDLFHAGYHNLYAVDALGYGAHSNFKNKGLSSILCKLP